MRKNPPNELNDDHFECCTDFSGVLNYCFVTVVFPYKFWTNLFNEKKKTTTNVSPFFALSLLFHNILCSFSNNVRRFYQRVCESAHLTYRNAYHCRRRFWNMLCLSACSVCICILYKSKSVIYLHSYHKID